MSVSLNTQISANAYQTNQNLKPKISKENEVLKNQIIAIGMTNPDKASMLSRKIVMWDGSQRGLDDLRRYNRMLCLRINERTLGKLNEFSINKEMRSWKSMMNYQDFSKA